MKVEINTSTNTAHVPEMYLGSSKLCSYDDIAWKLNRVLTCYREEIPVKVLIDYTDVTTLSVDELEMGSDGRIEALDKLCNAEQIDAFFVSFQGWMAINRKFSKFMYRDRIMHVPVGIDKEANHTYSYWDGTYNRQLKFYTEADIKDELIHAVRWNRKEAK